MKRKIAVVTGSRAEYGLLYWLLKEIKADNKLDFLLIVTAMHLSPEFGLTKKYITEDGFEISYEVEMLLSSDTPNAIAKSMGLGTTGFADAYRELKPDILVVLGDRFEILSAVCAAIPFRIPIAHIHGGESTEGAIDEQIRHAISKISHIHFTSTETYRNVLIQMGESPDRVFNFGTPGLDYINRIKLLSKSELSGNLGIDPRDRKIIVCTFHPVTLERETAKTQFLEILSVLSHLDDFYIIFTMPNADTEGRVVFDMITDFVRRYPDRSKAFVSLGQARYLSLLKYAAVMIGNSSSGIIESASFKLPVVNIGDRQRGRLQSGNVINCHPKRKMIEKAIGKALSDPVKQRSASLTNIYGNGSASGKIKEVLKTIKLGEYLVKKKFHDLS